MSDLPEPDVKDVSNFGWLCGWLGRGADPNPAGFAWLTGAAGIKTIVNLRAEDNTEAALSGPLGFSALQIPVVDNMPPTLDQAASWLQLCADQATRPIYVHCQSGHGRTSTFCVLVRLAMGWKLSDAIDEEVNTYGFKPDRDAAQVAFLHAIVDMIEAGTFTLPALS